MHSLKTIKEQNKSNAKKLIDLTIKNGGVSFNNELLPIEFSDGFIVSILRVIKTVDYQELEKKINHLKHNAYMLRFQGFNSEFYGIYQDNYSQFHLDRNILLKDYQEAFNLGLRRKQLSIWDCKNGIEIKLKGGE